MLISYLNVARANDLENNFDRHLYRFLEILPGFLSWSTLFLTVILSFLTPFFIAIFIIIFDFFWFLKVIYLTIHQISSFLKMRESLKKDWFNEVKKQTDFKKIYHLIIIPFYKEGEEIIESSLKAILESDYPKENLIIVLAGEERGGEKTKTILKEMEKKFKNNFFRFWATLHPKDLPGEIAGKGANVNFALEQIKEKIESLKIEKENIIFSVFDVDTKPYPQYFACVTFNYLALGKPKNVCFQPIPVYNNNIWDAPSFSRVIATSNTFWQMIQQERPEQLVSYSSHSLPYITIEQTGYPKNVVSDDSRVFWKLYLLNDGNFKVIPLFYPISMDAVFGKNLWQTVVNQYRQQRRWAFGAENIPFLIFGFIKNKKISFKEKLRHTIIILEGFWSWAVASILIFALGWLPLFLGGKKFQATILSYNLPVITRNLMSVSMIGVIVCAIISLLLLPPKPKNFSKSKKIWIFFQWILLPITLIVFGSFPALDAQTRLMLGKYLGFWTTEKYRKNGASS